MSKNILYLSYDGMTDPLGQSQVLPYICGLTKHGCQFTLISCEKPDKFEKNKSIIEEICKNNNIDWQPIVYHKSPPILSTIWDLFIMWRKIISINFQKSFALVHCRGYLSALLGLKMKRKFSTKFLFDIRGFWADEKKDAGAWDIAKPHYRWVYNYFKSKEKEFYTESDYTISLTSAGKKEILSWEFMRGHSDNLEVIPCCADTDLFDISKISEETKLAWRSKLGISTNQTIITYLGSIGTWYMLDEMLDFYKVAKEKYSDSRFLFITHDEHDRIRNAAAQRGLSDDILIQSAQRSEVPELLSVSDFSVFFIRSTYSKMSSSPTKQGEIMAMGIPIICNRGVGDTDMIVEKYQSGISVAEFNHQFYSKSLDKFAQLKFDSNHIRNGAIEYFSLEKGVEKYLKVYKKILYIFMAIIQIF